ncbi:MAG TPA: lysophospholipid acyltransferase family protein [Patescibacteria group bacterium]|nr:lysophospholipid acyltransferase family protein [Patescibacteria group bacterium]
MEKLSRKLARAIVPPLAAALIRLTRWTMRLSWVGRERVDALRAQRRPYIHAFWHGHLFMMPYSYLGDRIAIMISAHHDGELIARTMKRFGHEAIRGSSTSGGAVALRAAVRALRGGADVGFTPDGPRGPRHRAQMGAVAAARLSGAPIVPVVFAASRRKVMRSWDGFIVPMPFSRGVFVYGEPIEVPASAGAAQLESARLLLEQRLSDLTRRAGTLATRAADAVAGMGTHHV